MFKLISVCFSHINAYFWTNMEVTNTLELFMLAIPL